MNDLLWEGGERGNNHNVSTKVFDCKHFWQSTHSFVINQATAFRLIISRKVRHFVMTGFLILYNADSFPFVFSCFLFFLIILERRRGVTQ